MPFIEITLFLEQENIGFGNTSFFSVNSNYSWVNQSAFYIILINQSPPFNAMKSIMSNTLNNVCTKHIKKWFPMNKGGAQINSVKINKSVYFIYLIFFYTSNNFILYLYFILQIYVVLVYFCSIQCCI